MPFPAAPADQDVYVDPDTNTTWVWLAAGPAWRLADQFVVQVERWTAGGVKVVEVQRLTSTLATTGTAEYLSGVPLVAWTGDPATLLDQAP